MKKASPLRGMILLFLVSGSFFFSCGQEPIFYEISLEEELVPPRISGTPTNIVLFDQKMYVAGERLHQYAPWTTSIPQPKGKISSLAATDTHLYALTGELSGTRLYRKAKNSDAWVEIIKHERYPILQNIYGDSTRLFVGAQNRTTGPYAILYDQGGKLTLLKEDTKLLKGAVLDGNHLIATLGDGIFALSDSSMVFPQNPVSGTEGKSFSGLIHTGSAVVAVSRNGIVYSGNAGGFAEKAQGDLTFTGALALGTWGGNTLLLLGVQGGKGAGGYREILLSGDSWKIRTPGEDETSSVSNKEKYHSSIANHPVNHIFQVPAGLDSAMTLFASTQKDGLWSYRRRGGEGQWNREP
ncbi:MAG: hypothetical protein LBP43_06675 [Treponema sp.]|nr:hypothetical protein [Treponema sp.]